MAVQGNLDADRRLGIPRDVLAQAEYGKEPKGKERDPKTRLTGLKEGMKAAVADLLRPGVRVIPAPGQVKRESLFENDEGMLLGIQNAAPNTPEFHALVRQLRNRFRETLKPGFAEKVQQLRDDIAELERGIEAQKAAHKGTGALEDSLGTARELLAESTALYKDIKEIGRGGFGVVYKATDTETGEEVVLKIVEKKDQEQVERLIRESKVLIGMEKQDGILKGYLLKEIGSEGIHGIPDSAGKMLIETEFIKGSSGKGMVLEFEQQWQSFQGDLSKILSSKILHPSDRAKILETRLLASGKQHKDLKPGEKIDTYDLNRAHLREKIERAKDRGVARLIAQSCQAVAHAHSMGILHRDIKPENIMIDEKGNPKVIDWGLVRTLNESKPEQRKFEKSDRLHRPAQSSSDFSKAITDSEEVLGTPYFMAPEIILANPQYTPAADIWAMGVSLAWMLTGKYPFEGRSAADVMERAMRSAPADQAIQDTALRAIVLKALQKDPLQRFASMEAFQQALEAYLKGTE